MKFSDIFLPRIAHSNPEVRKAAIKKEINVELLKQVVEKDNDPAVADMALNRIRELRPQSV